MHTPMDKGIFHEGWKNTVSTYMYITNLYKNICLKKIYTWMLEIDI